MTAHELSVLVVDDDEVDRETVRRALAAEGLAVREASLCADARAALATGSFAAVLLDYRLPDGDGLEFLHELRRAGLAAPVLILTGQGDQDVAVRLMKAGATDYLVKGRLEGRELAQAVRSAIRVHVAEEQAASAERERHRLLDFTAAVTESLAEGILAVDLDGRITFVNTAACHMLARAREHLLGEDARAAVLALGPDGAPAPPGRGETVRTLRPGEARRVEDAWMRRADGSAFPVSYVVSPILDEGAVRGAVVAFHDTSERKRAEAELEAGRRQVAVSERMAALGTLVSGVAHEIRTPLTYVANNLHLARHRVAVAAAAHPSLAPLANDVSGFVAGALEGVDRVNALVKDLRRFSDGDAGRREYVTMAEIAASAVRLFQATQRGRIDVQADLRPTALVHADAQQMQRVVLNLLINAADAMPAGGTVRVATRDTPDGAVVEVEDEGTGLPAEVEARIFEPFFTTKQGGLGLGLSICKRIVDAHEGRIGHARAPRGGTVFTVTLPSLFEAVAVRGASTPALAGDR